MFKEYIFPAFALILAAALLILAGQFIAQTSLAAGIRAAAANQSSEISGAVDVFSLLSGFAISLIKQTLLIGLPAIVTWNILKRTQKG